MEHRWGQRQQLILRVRLSGTCPAATGWLTDISVSGAYVRTLARLSLMSQVNIQVEEPLGGKSRDLPPPLQGRIVRHGPTGLGIEWDNFASETLAQISRFAIPMHRMVTAVDEVQSPSLWPLATFAASHGMRFGTEP